jgi:hypothetical protein
LSNLGVAAAEVSMRGRAAAVAKEEAGVEAAVEETSSSDVDDGRVESNDEETDGDLEFWDENKMTQGGLLFIGSKISANVLN